jgi:hypothetical protein
MKDQFIRIFISSTFRDMQRERDVMMARVFPEVRRWCERRGVIWREIDHFRDRSITEIEIEAGVLRQPALSPTVLFYFRDPEFLKRLPATENLTDYRSTTEEAQTRLQELKVRIEASGHKIRRFSTPQELEEVMTVDLLDMLEKRIVASGPEGVSDSHWNFGRIRGRFFVGPSSWLRCLDRHVMGGGAPLLVTGEAGSGKSTVIATWALSKIGGDQTIILDPEPWWRRIQEQYLTRDPVKVPIVPWLAGAIEEREDSSRWPRPARQDHRYRGLRATEFGIKNLIAESGANSGILSRIAN